MSYLNESMELENEQESNDLSSKLSDISENEDELPVKEIENEELPPVRGIANLFSKLSNKIESAGEGKVEEDEGELPVRGIANLFQKLNNKIGNEGEIKNTKKFDVKRSNLSENAKKFDNNLGNKNAEGNGVSILSIDKASNSALSDVSKNESEEDEPGLILSDDEEEKIRKRNRSYSSPLNHKTNERQKYDYKSMYPPRYTTNIYRSESNYPDAFHVRERITSKDGGSYVRYYTQNGEYDDSSYFSQSEPNAHRDYSEELEYYKYRDHKRKDKSLDREYYDDQSPEKSRDHRKKSKHRSKKSRRDKEVSDNDDLHERENRKRKYGSHNKSEFDNDGRPVSKHTYEAERKSRRRRRRKSSSYDEMSDDSCIIEEDDLRDVRKKRSKKGRKYEKEISVIESSEEDFEISPRGVSEERYVRSKKDMSKERHRKRSRSKSERSLERIGHKPDINTIDSGQKRTSDEHKFSEHRKEKKSDKNRRIGRENENLNKLKEKNIAKLDNVSSSKSSESNHDAALWITLQNMAKLHNEKYKEYKNNPSKYPNYKEEYELFSKLQTEKKSEFGESSKELDLDQEWELYWPKRLNEIVKETWVTKKEEFIQNKNSMALCLQEQNTSSMKSSNKVNVKCSDDNKNHDDNKLQKNHNITKNVATQEQLLPISSSAPINPATTENHTKMKTDKVIEAEGTVNKESSLQQSNSSHCVVNQSHKENAKTDVSEKNVNVPHNAEKGKASTVDDGIVWLLRFLLTLKKYLASLILPIEGLYNEAIEFQNKGISPIKILEEDGHVMVLQLVVNKFGHILKSDCLSIGEKALYGKIMEQLNNLIKGGSEIGSKQQKIKSQDEKKKKENYQNNFNKHDSNMVKDDNRNVQIKPQNSNQIKEEHKSHNNDDAYISHDYTRKMQVESQDYKVKGECYRNFNKGDHYNLNLYNHKAQIDSQETQIKEEYHRSYNRENARDFNDYNRKEQKESQHNHSNEEYHQSFDNHNSYDFNDYNRNAQIGSHINQIKEEYPRNYNRRDVGNFQDYNHRRQVDSQDNRIKEEFNTGMIKEDPYNRIKEEFNTGMIKEDPYSNNDYNHKRDMYRENLPEGQTYDFQKDENYHGIQESKEMQDSQDLNDEEIDHIARTTMDWNSDKMIQFIENSLAYKGVDVGSKEKLRSIFMSVRAKQLGIISS